MSLQMGTTFDGLFFGLPPSNLTISILLTLYMLIVHSRKRKGVESTIFKIPCEQLKPFVHPKYHKDVGLMIFKIPSKILETFVHSKNSKDAGLIDLNFLATTSKHDSLHGHSIFGFA